MYITAPVVLICVLASVSCYDCYDQKCEGKWQHVGDFVACDQRHNHCKFDRQGRAKCAPGVSGSGAYCNWPYRCESLQYNGDAHCGENFAVMVVLIVGPAVLVVTIGVFYLCCCRRRCLKKRDSHKSTAQQRVPPATVISNTNIVPSLPTPTSQSFGTTYYHSAGYPTDQMARQDGQTERRGSRKGGRPTQGTIPDKPPAYDLVAPTAPSAAPPRNEFPTNPHYRGD